MRMAASMSHLVAEQYELEKETMNLSLLISFALEGFLNMP
jgi:hypothetical protein